jgi:hypothetical protein
VPTYASTHSTILPCRFEFYFILLSMDKLPFNFTFEIIHAKVVDQLKQFYFTQMPIFILSLGLEKIFKEWN